MNTNNDTQRSRGTEELWLHVVLFLCTMLLAWPALFVGFLLRAVLKQSTNPRLHWLLATGLGLSAAAFLYLRGNIYPLVLAEANHVVPLILHTSGATVMQLLTSAWPVWFRSILLSPLVAALIEFFSAKSLEVRLLTQERQRRSRQQRTSHQAARRVRKAPTQIHGQAVFGAVIEDPGN